MRTLTLIWMAGCLGGCIEQTETEVEDAELVTPIPRADAEAPDPDEDPEEGLDAAPPDAEPASPAVDAAPLEEPPLDAVPPPRPIACPNPAVVQDELFVRPLDIVELDGSPSRDPDGEVMEWLWTVVTRPDGSTSQPVERFDDPRRPNDTGAPDDPTTPAVFFFVDLAGRYELELRAVDEQGNGAGGECPAVARVVIDATSDRSIHIQLVWDTPGDEDQTDGEGTDVDLHVLHPTGRAWGQAPLDCYYANGNPDWGQPGPSGNPSLDIDDVNGAGPENINVDEPEDTAALNGMYRVGIDYYRAENFARGGTWGPSIATVRIYLEGALAYEGRREMTGTHHFWEVAGIVWTADDRRVVEIDRYLDSVP